MDTAVECTHCKVVMTSWSAPGSPIRYFQCPFCARTHSSLYGEVFQRRAGARVVDAPVRAATAGGAPMATPEDMRWARVKATAARWFARLEEERLDRGIEAGARRRAIGPGSEVPALEAMPAASVRRAR